MLEDQVESMLYGFDADWHAIIGFAMKVNDACDTALDISDVDFFNVQQCRELVKLLDGSIAIDDAALAKFAVDLKAAVQRAGCTPTSETPTLWWWSALCAPTPWSPWTRRSTCTKCKFLRSWARCSRCAGRRANADKMPHCPLPGTPCVSCQVYADGTM